jgi:hypothetical protein
MARYERFVHELLDRVEDVYDPRAAEPRRLRAAAREAFGEHRSSTVITEMLESFRVHYVLNMFNGVEQSFTRRSSRWSRLWRPRSRRG